MTSTHAPAPEQSNLDTIEAAWSAPAIDPLQRNVAAASVPDEPRASTLLDDLLVKTLFAILVIGALVLLAITTLG